MTRHRVAALALPGLVTFDLGCALQIFGHGTGSDLAPGLYDLVVAALDPPRVTTSDGFALAVEHGLEALDTAGTVVVPGYAGAWLGPPAPPACRALREAADRGARVMSICVGAFALAHAGLLRGRRATTHWAAASALAEQFPDARVLPDVLYVDDGPVLTSAGLSGGLDLCLHVVRRDHGAQAANELARWNVVAPHRAGNQAQFAPTPVRPDDDSDLAATRAWALRHLDEPLGLDDLAEHARLSQRSLLRRFRAETGCTPKQWLLRARLDRARELLETTNLPIEDVARRAGFGHGAALRHRFTTILKTSPTSYRRSFHRSEQNNA